MLLLGRRAAAPPDCRHGWLTSDGRINWTCSLIALLTVSAILETVASNTAAANPEGRAAPRVYTNAQKTHAEENKQAAKESGALRLSDDTYTQFKASHPLSMIMYYAPWCYWSRAALPEFDAAAKLLAHHNPAVVLATVDCIESEQVANNEDIREFPTIRLYIDGKAHAYDGRRFRTHLVHWVDSRVDRDKALSSPQHLDEMIESSANGHVVVVAAFPSNYSKSAFESVARVFGEDVLFGDASDSDVVDRLLETHVLPRLSEAHRKEYGELKPPYVVVFSPHQGETPVHIYRGSVAEVNELRSFIRQWLLPIVSLFDADAISNSFFQDTRPKLVLIVDSKRQHQLLDAASTPNSKHALLGPLQRVASRFRSSVATAISGNSQPFEKQLVTLLGAEDEQLPVVRILSVNHDSDGKHHPVHKFRPKGLLIFEDSSEKTETALAYFISEFLANRINPYFRSEAVPEVPEPRGRVKIIVSSNFQDEIRRAQNVFVEFYAPWCGFCRKMEPSYKELAVRLKNQENVVVAKIDATRNEVDSIKVSGYPTLFLFRSGSDEPLIYNGDRSTEDMLRWLSVRIVGAPLDITELMAADLSGESENPTASVLEEL